MINILKKNVDMTFCFWAEGKQQGPTTEGIGTLVKSHAKKWIVCPPRGAKRAVKAIDSLETVVGLACQSTKELASW